MEFYVFEAMKTSEGTAAAHRVYSDRDEAFMNFYQVMASACANPDVTGGECVILNDHCGIEMSAPVVRTQPEGEEA